jgi:virulence factor Mce-like protein
MIKAPPRPATPAAEPSRPLIPVPRRRRIPAAILGPILVAGAITGAFFGIKTAYGGFGHYYYLTVGLPRTGQNLDPGSDVRMRGVVVGKVSREELVERQVRMTLQIDRQYRVPASAQVVVTLKTLLGAKYVDLQFPEYRGPFLADGARIQSGQVGPELEDALADGVNVLNAIRPTQLATIVINLAQGARGHGEDIARSLRANAQLSTMFAQTLSPQLRSLYDFDVVFGALKGKAVDLNRLADAINVGVPVYSSPQAQRYLQQALDALQPFANNLADLLIYNRADWDRMIASGDVVLGAIAARPQALQSLVVGLYRYVFKLGAPPFALSDGSAAAGFVNFIGGDNPNENRKQICDAFPPPVREQIPLCNGEIPP